MATEAELIDYYADLLIMQYKGKPKADAHIRAIVKLALMDMLPFTVMESYNLDVASGYQLDVIGKYQGVTRTGYTFSKQITLDDNSFKILIQMAIIKNTSGASLYEIDGLINKYFGNEMQVFDYGKMRIGYFINTNIASSNLIEMMITQGLLPKPMGVSLSSTIRYPILDKFFGYSTYSAGVNPNNSPYNTYDDYQTDRPWVSYKMIVGQPTTIDAFITTELLGQRINQENDGHMIS